MAVVHYVYAKFLVHAITQDKVLDWDADTIKVSLHTSSWTPNQDTDSVWSTPSNEITGTGYTTGGATLGSKTNATTNNVLALDAADPAWTASTFSAVRRCVFYDDTPASSANKPLISFGDFGSDQSVSSGTFTINLNAAGLIEHRDSHLARCGSRRRVRRRAGQPLGRTTRRCPCRVASTTGGKRHSIILTGCKKRLAR
jgi:hypothetical protein